MTLCNDPTEPRSAMLFSPFGFIYQPTSPCPTLSAYTEPKEIAGSNITNCLKRTVYALAFKAA